MRHANLSTTLVYAHHTSRMLDDSEAALEAFILKEEKKKQR
jgi:hypothetical protein